ncbi:MULTISPECIES: cupin domain-containing protein [Priestia]|uniref:cupin domain-containing protein n=1 Tax=Priestia TaxID=2800373 RepID=UPI00210C2962|nr:MULTISPECIES: cupin domain-containing protein [Priestia]MDG0030488.1 cupin domain-containing protein [Priestia sp. Y58]
MSELKNIVIKPLHGIPNDQNTYHFMQETITILASGEDTNGAFSVVHLVEPPKMGPPLHVHENEDETFYIKKGRFIFFVGDEILEVNENEYVFAPKGIPHRFEAGIDGGEMIVTASPAKFDSFVKELGLQVPKDSGLPDFQGPTPEQMQQLVNVAEKYNYKFILE